MGLGRHLHRWWRPAALAPGMQDGTYVDGVLTLISETVNVDLVLALQRDVCTLDIGLRTRWKSGKRT